MDTTVDKKHNKHAKAAEPHADTPDPQVETASAPALMTPEQIEQLKEQAGKAEEYRNRLMREAADFDNYKKRAARERQDAITYANESLLQKIIPILDTFEMALAASGAEGATVQSLQAGVQMIYNQIKTALADAGLEEIDARGKVFDPNLHEAVSQEERTDVPEGQVTQQTRKGYKFRQRLVRPAGVVVARKPST